MHLGTAKILTQRYPGVFMIKWKEMKNCWKSVQENATQLESIARSGCRSVIPHVGGGKGKKLLNLLNDEIYYCIFTWTNKVCLFKARQSALQNLVESFPQVRYCRMKSLLVEGGMERLKVISRVQGWLLWSAPQTLVPFVCCQPHTARSTPGMPSWVSWSAQPYRYSPRVWDNVKTGAGTIKEPCRKGISLEQIRI